jgi:uncharacterized protein
MNTAAPTNHQVFSCLFLEFFFWYLTFALKLLNFWFSMAVAVTILSTLAAVFGGLNFQKSEITIGNFLRGLFAALILYGIFQAGNTISQTLFHFAKPEISSIYNIRNEGQVYLITAVLLFITSPGEEFFWRGFVQRWAMNRLGRTLGWLTTAIIYGTVHITSGNIILVMAALVAGLFWGWLYQHTNSLFVCMISHAVWTAGIFILFPVL